MDDNNTTTTEENKEDAQVQTFTQAQNDKLVGQAIVREREKYADYAENKEMLETLLAEKKERDLANKSESEKLQSINSELTTELTNVKSELTNYQKKQVRNDVLNAAKYQTMPRAYKNMVTLSDNAEDVMKSAEEVLEEYNKDTGGKIQSTFGIKSDKDTIIAEPAKEIANPTDLANSLRSKVLGMIKNNNRG